MSYGNGGEQCTKLTKVCVNYTNVFRLYHVFQIWTTPGEAQQASLYHAGYRAKTFCRRNMLLDGKKVSISPSVTIENYWSIAPMRFD